MNPYYWVKPGVLVRCVNDTADNGLALPIKVGSHYRISGVEDTPYVSRVGSALTVSLVGMPKPNRFWADRFEPLDMV